MSQITTHILDTTQGKPAANVLVTLSCEQQNIWFTVGQGVTDLDGRVANLVDQNTALDAGSYKIRFEVESYLDQCQVDGFYPFVEIAFKIKGDGQHYHVPLLLNPFGYSTYRGS